MASRLDDLALALTEPMSRRRAIRLAAGAAATTYLGLPAGRASGQRPCNRTPVCEPGTRVCVPSRQDGCPGCCTPREKCCVGAANNANTACCNTYYGFDCGPLTFSGSPTCACAPDNTCVGISGELCCRPEETCVVEGGEPRCCMHPCGKTCCERDQKCADPDRGVCCSSWEKGCRGRNRTVCCDDFHEKCCAGTKITQCCGRGQTCEDNGACICKPDRPVDCLDDCCKKTERCCTSPAGKGFCIPKTSRCCGEFGVRPGDECCAGRMPYTPSVERCCGISGTCPRTWECCPIGCCVPGSYCCAGGCCFSGSSRVIAARPFTRRSSRRHVRRRAGRR